MTCRVLNFFFSNHFLQSLASVIIRILLIIFRLIIFPMCTADP